MAPRREKVKRPEVHFRGKQGEIKRVEFGPFGLEVKLKRGA
jgi:hypothetical protein